MVQSSCLQLQSPWNCRFNPHFLIRELLRFPGNFHSLRRRLQQLVSAHRRPTGSPLDAASTVGSSLDTGQEAGRSLLGKRWCPWPNFFWMVKSNDFWWKFPLFPYFQWWNRIFFHSKSHFFEVSELVSRVKSRTCCQETEFHLIYGNLHLGFKHSMLRYAMGHLSSILWGSCLVADVWVNKLHSLVSQSSVMACTGDVYVYMDICPNHI